MCFQFKIQVKKSYLMYTNIVESIKCIERTKGTYHYLSKVLQTLTADTGIQHYDVTQSSKKAINFKHRDLYDYKS